MRRLLSPLYDYVEATNADLKGPATEGGFKAYLAGLSKQKLADLQISNTPEMFLSPRDHQPFVINYAIPLTGGAAPAIWEQTGLNSQRCVLYQDGKFEELDNEKLNKLTATLKP